MCCKTKFIIKATIYNKRGIIISTAINSYTKTHPIQYKYALKAKQPYKQMLHAEILAIIRAKGKGYSIFIERYNKQGIPMLAAPCSICQLALKEAGIKYVTYTM